MNFGRLLKRLEKLTIDNSPTILSGVAIAGVVSTAYFTGVATLKANQLLNEEDDQVFYNVGTVHRPSVQEKLQLVWKCYIPPVAMGAITIAAIIGANHVNTRRATALAAAYSISERTFSEYKDKVVEKIGEKKEQAFRDELAQERVDANPASENVVIITDGGDVLCYDHFSGRYFKSSMETIKKAQNDINYQILHDGFACVSDLYDLLGLKPTRISEEVGWNSDRLLDIQFSTVLSEDGRPCISIDFDLSPNRKFSHFAGE